VVDASRLDLGRGSVSDVHGETGGTGSRDAPLTVHRVALVDRLAASDEPVVSVVAPPGYGKSTLLAQWAERLARRVAWVSCEQLRNDSESLAKELIAALVIVEPTGERPPELRMDDSRPLVQQVTHLLATLTAPVTLVVDQLETVCSREGRDLVAALALAVPAGSQLALASREQVPLPVARMRLQRRLLEIGTDDLAMSRSEVSQLLTGAGVGLSDAVTDRLVRQTEGWPAACRLAVLAVRAGDASPERGITGDDRLMRDYLRSEVLDRLSRAHVGFLVRTSILDRLNGELGAAVAGGGNATGLLERLARRNLLVVPVDGRGEWYRCHRLLREMLHAELRRDSPDLIPALHLRAATWFEAAGDLEAAVEHASLAGDVDAFGRLVLEAMQPVWASGRVDTVHTWMERLGRRSPVAHAPAMIAHGALIFALLGEAGDAERWAAVAEALPATGALPDGSTVEATMARQRCAGTPSSPWRD
jgi:LuxR family maltose regulon positive regulatory protein